MSQWTCTLVLFSWNLVAKQLTRGLREQKNFTYYILRLRAHAPAATLRLRIRNAILTNFQVSINWSKWPASNFALIQPILDGLGRKIWPNYALLEPRLSWSIFFKLGGLLTIDQSLWPLVGHHVIAMKRVFTLDGHKLFQDHLAKKRHSVNCENGGT